MKLNEDCARAVMMYLETNLSINISSRNVAKFISVSLIEICQDLLEVENFPMVDTYYAVYILSRSGYIETDTLDGRSNVLMASLNIYTITAKGNQFLEAIKPETSWESTKRIAANVGNHTLHFLEDTAQKIAVEAAKASIVSKIR